MKELVYLTCELNLVNCQSKLIKVASIQSLAFDNDLVITLSTKQTAWKHAFSNFRIEYGHCDEPYELLRHGVSAYRRQATPTALIPTSSPTATTANLDLTSKAVNTTFALTNKDPNARGISLGCKNCTTTGHLSLTQGAFNLIKREDVRLNTNVFDIISEGSVQLDMNFTAYIELQASPYKTGSLTHPLFAVPLFGFRVCSIQNLGVRRS